MYEGTSSADKRACMREAQEVGARAMKRIEDVTPAIDDDGRVSHI